MSPVSLIFHIKSTANSCPLVAFGNVNHSSHSLVLLPQIFRDTATTTVLVFLGTFRDIDLVKLFELFRRQKNIFFLLNRIFIQGKLNVILI